MIKKINKTINEWKEILPPDVFAITRGGGTEPAFRNAYWDNKRPGIYNCSNCNLALFSSKHKYDSGTGWPSFWKAYRQSHIKVQGDVSHGMLRHEVLCARCGAHLGHVFSDGPKPTGLRFCMNSAAFTFESKNIK